MLLKVQLSVRIIWCMCFECFIYLLKKMSFLFGVPPKSKMTLAQRKEITSLDIENINKNVNKTTKIEKVYEIITKFPFDQYPDIYAKIYEKVNLEVFRRLTRNIIESNEIATLAMRDKKVTISEIKAFFGQSVFRNRRLYYKYHSRGSTDVKNGILAMFCGMKTVLQYVVQHVLLYSIIVGNFEAFRNSLKLIDDPMFGDGIAVTAILVHHSKYGPKKGKKQFYEIESDKKRFLDVYRSTFYERIKDHKIFFSVDWSGVMSKKWSSYNLEFTSIIDKRFARSRAKFVTFQNYALDVGLIGKKYLVGLNRAENALFHAVALNSFDFLGVHIVRRYFKQLFPTLSTEKIPPRHIIDMWEKVEEIDNKIMDLNLEKKKLRGTRLSLEYREEMADKLNATIKILYTKRAKLKRKVLKAERDERAKERMREVMKMQGFLKKEVKIVDVGKEQKKKDLVLQRKKLELTRCLNMACATLNPFTCLTMLERIQNLPRLSEIRKGENLSIFRFPPNLVEKMREKKKLSGVYVL